MQPKPAQLSTQSRTSPGSSVAVENPLAVLTGLGPLLTKLEKWAPMYDPPGALAELSTASSALQRSMAPASPVQYQQAEADLKRWMQGFGMQSAAPDVVLAAYRKTLAALPGDLLALAVERIITTWKWGAKPPLPADILATVREDHTRRMMLASKAKMAEQRAVHLQRQQALRGPVIPKISDAERDEILARYRQQSRTSTP